MLKEFKNVRQVENIDRKLYTDNYFDLYLWYKKDSDEFIGFQLIYCAGYNKMALTAEVGSVPFVNRVDSGDGELYNPTDLLDGSGSFPKDELYREFYKRSSGIDKEISRVVLNVIDNYIGSNSDLSLTSIY